MSLHAEIAALFCVISEYVGKQDVLPYEVGFRAARSAAAALAIKADQELLALQAQVAELQARLDSITPARTACSSAGSEIKRYLDSLTVYPNNGDDNA